LGQIKSFLSGAHALSRHAQELLTFGTSVASQSDCESARTNHVQGVACDSQIEFRASWVSTGNNTPVIF